MTRIDQRNAPGLGFIQTAYNVAQAQELKAKDDKAEVKGPKHLEALDPAKAQFLQEIFGTQQVGVPGGELGIRNEAALLAAQTSDASALFAPLAQQLSEPKPGQPLGKAFAGELKEKPAPAELGQLSSMQLVAGGLLLANLQKQNLPKQAQLLSHYHQFFNKMLSGTPAGGAAPGASTSPQAKASAQAQAKLKAGALFGTFKSYLSNASANEEPGAVTPWDKDIVAAVDGEAQPATGHAAEDAPSTAAVSSGTDGELHTALEEAVKKLDSSLQKSDMPAGMTIEQMVEWVFMEMGKDVEDDVRGLLEEMQNNYKKKQATTQLMQQYKDAQISMERKMRDEYQALQAMTPPRIGKGVPFEEYKAWRQVSWPTPTPHPLSGEYPPLEFQTCQPWPPIMPTYLTRDRDDKASAVNGPGSTKHTPGNPEDPEVKFGLPAELDNSLKQIFNGMPADLKDGMTYDEWLQQVVGLDRVGNLDDVKLNADNVKEFLDNLPTELSKHTTQVNDAKKAGETSMVQTAGAVETYLAALFPPGGTDAAGWKTFWDSNGAVLNGTIATMLTDLISKLGNGGLALPNGTAVTAALDKILAMFEGKEPLGANGGNIKMLVKQARDMAAAYKDEPNKKLFGQSVTLKDVGAKAGVDLEALRLQALAQCSYETVGIGPIDLATQALTGIETILTTNTPPLSEEQRKALQDLVTRYKGDLSNSSEVFLDELRDMLIGEDYREGGKYYAITEAIIGKSEPVQPKAPGGIALASDDIAAAANLKTQEAMAVHVSGGATKIEKQLGNDIKFVGGKAGIKLGQHLNFGGVATGNSTGDAGWDKPEEVGDRLRNWLLGDDSNVDLSDWEKNAIKQGIIDDPALVAAARRAEIEQQKRIEAEEKAAAQAAAIGQGAQNAAAGHSNMGGLDNLKLEVDKLQSQVDGMGDFGQMQSMRLQIFMDRRAKFFETLSNIMKKSSTIIETIIGNVKS